MTYPDWKVITGVMKLNIPSYQPISRTFLFYPSYYIHFVFTLTLIVLQRTAHIRYSTLIYIIQLHTMRVGNILYLLSLHIDPNGHLVNSWPRCTDKHDIWNKTNWKLEALLIGCHISEYLELDKYMIVYTPALLIKHNVINKIVWGIIPELWPLIVSLSIQTLKLVGLY